MRFQWQHLAAGAAAILILMLTWFGPQIFHVAGTNAIVLRGGILLLGVIAVIGLVLWARSSMPTLPAAEEVRAPAAPSFAGASSAASAGASQDVDILIRDAAVKVAAARLAAGARLSSLPVVFLLGDTGAGKTSVMDQSGLDAELLAGQVYQESSIVPTRVANLWFARKTVFVEAGGPLMDDASSWVRLIKHFVPSRFRSIFGGASLAPRAAIVCVDSEKLVREAALEKIVAQARKLRVRLEELSYHMGVSLPVYVLFNRSDRIPYFEEFAGTFSNEETSQVLGSTLPLVGSTSSGVYAERETKRLTAAFQAIFFHFGGMPPRPSQPRAQQRSASRRLRISSRVWKAQQASRSVPCGSLPARPSPYGALPSRLLFCGAADHHGFLERGPDYARPAFGAARPRRIQSRRDKFDQRSGSLR